MNKYDLSVLIPARNEMFLAKTVEGLLENMRGNTEIIVGLDGEWANPGLPEHPRVTVIYVNTSIGQRAMTNQLCRLSESKYVMKLDAHCIVDEGFDVKLMDKITDDMTIVPMMRNLHAFDWVCIGKNERSGKLYNTPEENKEKVGCGNRKYQGPTPEKCDKCSGNMDRELVWKAKESPRSTSFRFDKTLHFQYFNEYKNRPEGQGELTKSMSLQGSCFMLTREKYWELDICEEEFGSWGQQGVEVACKTWLSGGRVMCLQSTHYAHMFRTQGGDFSFPYKQSQKQISHARDYSRELFPTDKWPKAKRKFQWLLDEFYPVPDWHDEEHEKKEKKITKGVVYYTDSELNEELAEVCREQIKRGIKEKHIVSVSLKPLNFGKNIHMPLQRGYLTMAKQILAGLKASTADVIFFCEHDVKYHPSHFDFIPPDKSKVYYNTNVWRVRQDGHALYTDDLQQLSGLVAYRETLIKHYETRLKMLDQAYVHLEMTGRTEDFNKYVRAMGFEPGTHGRPERVDDLQANNYKSLYPNLDIRHEQNLTPSRWNKDQFRNERYTKGWKEADLDDEWSFDESTKYLQSI